MEVEEENGGEGRGWTWRRLEVEEKDGGGEDGGGLKVSVVLRIRISEGKRGIKRTGMKIRGKERNGYNIRRAQ